MIATCQLKRITTVYLFTGGVKHRLRLRYFKKNTIYLLILFVGLVLEAPEAVLQQ